MIVEMHCHTSEHSRCSKVPAAELVKRVYEMGIQAIVLTDHHYQWSHEELVDLRGGLPAIFCVLAAQEVTTRDFGHVLVYGAKDTIQPHHMTVRDIREQYPDAAIIWAHPYRDGRIPSPERLLDPLIDGVEIFSSNHTIAEALQALSDWHTHKFAAIGGTDAHAYSYAGTYPTLFDHPIDSIAGLAAEIRAGRCRPYFKEVPRTGTTPTVVKEITVGPKSARMRKQMIVKTFNTIETWRNGKRTHDIVEQLCKHGFHKGPYRVAKPLGWNTHTLCLVEERITGKSLFDALVQADSHEAPKLMEKAALWLVRLHNARLELTPKEEFLELEPDRLHHYLAPFVDMRARHLGRIRQVFDQVLEREIALVRSRPEILMQGHGDYHAKNILIGRVEAGKPEYVAVIDFHTSCQLPRACDVGTFLAQYPNMFFDHRDVQRNAPPELFLSTYLKRAEGLEDDFLSQVDLFKARACLSILYYLNKVGMVDSENFWKILVEAEKSLTSIEVSDLR
ncbi:MAG: phosphotransferase [Phycisphaerae bacterium]|nr:phosphotransferase [Phycisphaerae bacterium]